MGTESEKEPLANIFEVLKLEHRDVDALFEQVEALCEDSPDEATALLDVLAKNLLAHARAEEDVVYAKLLRVRELEKIMRRAHVEHELVERLLGELAAAPPDTGEWLAKLRVVHELVKHHVHEEEHRVFPIASEHMNAAEAKRLAAEFLDRKSRETGEPELERANLRTQWRPGILDRFFR